MKAIYQLIWIFLLFISLFVANAQATLQCGSIIESEFTEDEETQHFNVDMNPGDQLTVQGDALFDYLRVLVQVYAPTTGKVAHSFDTDSGSSGYSKSQLAQTGQLSERGTYDIRVQSIGVGLYTLSISCILRDGTAINPGDALPENSSSSPSTASDPVLSFSENGFPGLPPVDFSTVAKLPISVGSGVITPNGGEILGYTLDGNGGDVVDLTVNRVAGNLNLGLAVLSAENQVVFQASLITSSTLNTRFTLPSGGQYTIGVFRIDLLPPAAPEATAFQITATLNP